VSLPRSLVKDVRQLGEPELRRLLILVRGLLVGSEGPVIEPHGVPVVPPVQYRQQRIRCGKDCAACPHGPYWYAYWKEGGRARSQYIGRELPADVRRLLQAAEAEG
jgi:hypothetical protein